MKTEFLIGFAGTPHSGRGREWRICCETALRASFAGRVCRVGTAVCPADRSLFRGRSVVGRRVFRAERGFGVYFR